MVRPMKGQDQVDSGDSLIRAVLRKTAHVRYSKQSSQRREDVRRSFYALDTSGDGRLSLEEFLQSTAEVVRNGSSRVVSKIFSYVDEDKSGFLEFDEFIVFTFIMEAGFQICDNCLSPVIIAGYTCKTCWHQRSHENNTYDLCSSCFISDGFNHPASHELLETCHMYHYLLTTTSPTQTITSPPQVQCSVCEEYHTKDRKSLLVGDEKTHVVELEGTTPQKFVCEWCSSYLCSGCGKYFSAPSYPSVRTDQWLRKELRCNACVRGSIYEPDVDFTLKMMEETGLSKDCSACRKKRLEISTLKANNQAGSSSDQTYADLMTAQMESNLILQQSYFHAARMHNYGVGLFCLAP